MKNIKYSLIILVIGLAGCSKVLDIEPLDIIAETAVFKDKSLVEASLANLYQDTKFQEVSGQAYFNMGLIASMGGEARPFGDWQDPYIAGIKNWNSTGSGVMDYWAYPNIRRINEFIEGMEASTFEADYKNQKIGEAIFLRAFTYFGMVKRFGGIPIITKVQQETDSQEELYPKRNKEVEVYDFIGSEMDKAENLLPASYNSANFGRATKYAALALKSRALLYAGSIAQYGTVQLDGVVGIPASEASRLYDASMKASKKIMDANLFSLYNKFPSDPVNNFAQLFIDENNNSEVIFSEIWDAALSKGHSWDNLCTPAGFTAGWNSNFNVFLDFADLFDFQDGRSAKINRSLMGTVARWQVDSIFNNRDPRFKASMFYPESPWQGAKTFFHSKTTYTDPATNTRKTSTSETFVVPNSSSAAYPDGWKGKAPNRNTVKTGLYIRKRVDEKLLPAAGGQSSTDFMVFRYAEILLNYAEAALALNMTTEAIGAINLVRARAQMPARTSLTVDNVRQERQVELAFEEHRYYDLKRWHIAEATLNGVRLAGIGYDYDYDIKKYAFRLINAEGATRVFLPQHYYLPLGIGRIADNPNLVENPGY